MTQTTCCHVIFLLMFCAQKIPLIRRILPPVQLQGIIRFIIINYSVERIILFAHHSLNADSVDYLRYLFWSHTNLKVDRPYDILIIPVVFPPLHPLLGSARICFAHLGNPRAPIHQVLAREAHFSPCEKELFLTLITDFVTLATSVAFVINNGPPPSCP